MTKFTLFLSCMVSIIFYYLYFQRAKALKQKKEEGNEAFKLGKFQDAYNLYSEALKIDAVNKITNAKLYCNRATVSSKVIHQTNCDKFILSRLGTTMHTEY